MTNALPVDLAKVLRTLLLSDGQVNEIVRGRCYALGTFTNYSVPCVIFNLTGGETNKTLDGVEEDQYPTARLEVYSNDYDQAKELFDLVTTRLVNVDRLTIAGHLVEFVTLSQPEDTDEPLLTGQTLPDFVFATNLQACLSRVNVSVNASVNPPGYEGWLSRTLALGATPVDGTKNSVRQFFADFAAAGFALSDFDYAYLMIGENPADTSTNKYNQKRVNLFNPGTFDATILNPNASGHGALGTVGNVSMYWNTGYNSATRSVDRKNNASWGAVATAVPTPGFIYTTMGVQTSNHYLRAGYGDRRWAAYGTSESYTAIVAETFPSLLYAQTTGAAGSDLYWNTTFRGWQVESAEVPVAIGASSWFIYGVNNSGSPSQLTDETLAFAWHGRGLSAGERDAWYTMLQRLLSALGVTI
jgi:hypothetical protein